jgi:hypothetical protein
MTIRSTFNDGVHIVRWKEPQLADIVPLVNEVRRAREKHGKPIVGIAIMPTDSAPPSDEARMAMGRSMNDILQSIETVHFVMEGRGFAHSIKRSALSGVLLLGGKRGRVVVHSKVEEALREIAPRLTVTPREFEDRARKSGVLGSVLGGQPSDIK